MIGDSTRDRVLRKLNGDPGPPRSRPTISYWQQPPHKILEKIQSPQLPSETDVVIIGSGITACSVARELLMNDDSLQITILEARTITSGATGRNGGHVTSTAPQTYGDYADKLGKDAAQKIFRFQLSHFDEIYKAVAELGQEGFDVSELRKTEALWGAADESAFERLRKTVARIDEDCPEWRGLYKVHDRQTAVEKYQFAGVCGVVSGPGGAAWPYRMITAIYTHLLQRFADRLTMEALTEVTAVSDTTGSHRRYSVETSRGTIKANHVVYCTNAYTGHILPRLQGKIFTMRLFMTVQRPGQNFPRVGNTRTWDFIYGDRGLEYIQQNGKTGEIFVGGAAARAWQDGANDIGTANDEETDSLALIHLTGVLPIAFGAENWGSDDPDGPRLKANWSGIIGLTGDGFPLVGRLPETATGRKEGQEWIAAGFNGYGMVNCWLSGRAVAWMMLGLDPSPWLPEQYLASKERVEKLSPEAFVDSGYLNLT